MLIIKGVKVSQFSFERFEQEVHSDIKSSVLHAMDNAIATLEASLENLNLGNDPLPE